MKSNITLIGMPGAGKSTTGIILAKNLSYGFVDTDVLIQVNRQQSLQDIMDGTGYLNLRKIEEEEILTLTSKHHVIATGGSAVYSEKAMRHLQSLSTIVFLEVDFETIKKRIHDFPTRGIAKPVDQSFQELFHERQVLYRKYAELIIDCSTLTQEEAAHRIAAMLFTEQ